MFRLRYWALCLLLVMMAARGALAGQNPDNDAGADDGPQDKSHPELVLQIGHVQEITALAFSPDGSLVASASRDRTARLWDTQTGKLRQALTGHTAPVLAVAFTNDSHTVITASRNGVVKAWNVQTGALLGTFTIPAMAATAVAIWPGGADGLGKLLVASARQNHEVGVWRAPAKLSGRGETLTTLTGHDKEVKTLAFSADGKRIASGDANGTVKLWETEDGTLDYSLRDHAMPISSVAFSPDGKTLVGGCDDGIATLWNTGTGKKTGELQMNRPGDGIGAVAVASDNKTVVTGGHGGPKLNEFVMLWDASTGKSTHTLTGHEAYVTAAAFAADGRTLATGSRDFTVHLWDTQTGREIHRVGSWDIIPAIAFAPNGDQLASGSADAGVRLWNTRTGQLQHLLVGHKGHVLAVAYSADSALLASGGRDGTVRLWDPQTGAPGLTLKGEAGPVNAVAFSPDGTLVAGGCGATPWDGAILVWETKTGKLRHTLNGQSLGFVHTVAFSPDGAQLASGSGLLRDGEVRLWNVQTGEMLWNEFPHAVRSLAFTRDGKFLVTGSGTLDDNDNVVGDEIKVWNAKTHALQRTLNATEKGGWADTLAIAADDKTLFTGSRNGLVHMWNLRTGDSLKLLTGHLGQVFAVACASDGKRMASAGQDNSIRLWNAESGQQVATLLPLPAVDGEIPSAQWMTVTPNGYYDGSAASGRFIQWRVGSDLFPVEAYERAYHRPELLRKALQDLAPLATPEAQRFQSGDAIPPQIVVTDPPEGKQVAGDSVKVEMAVTDEHKVDHLEVLVNGRPVSVKPVEMGSKPIEVGAKPIEIGAKSISIPTRHKIAEQFEADVPLPAGASEVTLTVLAVNADGLQSRDEIHLRRAAAPGTAGTLYVLAVGVSAYQNPHYNLKYARQDAESFADLWKSQGGGLYGKVVVVSLTDAQATVANVRAALFKLLATATDNDTVAIFLSGHGVQGNGDDYYFATSEIDASSVARVAETALPWTDLQTALLGLKARRVLMFLDACHSGSALGGQQASNERMAELLAKQAGVMVFASSRASECSYELDDLRHGAFTAALIEGIGKGKADFEIAGRRDGVVTAEKLLTYLQARVPELTNNRQTPSCPLMRDFGDVFPVSKVK